MVEFFCATLNAERMIKIYEKIKLKKMEFECGYYAYLTFRVFFLAKPLIN